MALERSFLLGHEFAKVLREWQLGIRGDLVSRRHFLRDKQGLLKDFTSNTKTDCFYEKYCELLKEIT